MKEQLNFLEQFKQVCFQSGNHCALRIKEDDDYRNISYSDLWEKSQAISAFLIELGIREQENIILLFENRPEWAVCFFGIISAGCVAVPLEVKLKEKELAYILNDCKSRIIFVDSGNVECALRLKNIYPDLNYIICLDSLTDGKELIDYAEVVQDRKRAEPRYFSDDDTALIVYTSGTMGYQKGVQLTFSNFLFQLRSFKEVLSPHPEDKFLSLLPLSHTLEITAGLLGPLFSGCSITYIRSLKSKELIREIKDNKITIIIVVPLILRMFHNGILRNVEKVSKLGQLFFELSRYICRMSGTPGIFIGKMLFKKIHRELGSSMRCFICGGAPLDPVIVCDFELFGIPVLEGYGLTETSPVITVNTFKDKKIGSVGKPLEGVEVGILKENDKAKEGEIITRGPHLMKGYFNAPEKTQEIIKDGWLYTGDIGYIDKQGFLHISGRLKNVIVTGKGKKVFPEELETELLRSPYIKDVCVFGRLAKDGLRKGTEEVSAIIVPDVDYFLSHAQKATQEDIKWLIKKEVDETSKHFADYKKIVDFKISYDDLPKTTTRKVKRKEIEAILNKLDEI